MSASASGCRISPPVVVPSPNERPVLIAHPVAVNVSSVSSSGVPLVSWSTRIAKCACAPACVVSTQLQSFTSARGFELRTQTLEATSNA
jgi:hypothetical protein